MTEGDFILWLFAAALTVGLVALASWQVWTHRNLDERIAACDPSLLSSVSHKVETTTDAPPGSAIMPYVPVQMVPIAALGGPQSQPQVTQTLPQPSAERAALPAPTTKDGEGHGQSEFHLKRGP
jgi:hypothetical protein